MLLMLNFLKHTALKGIRTQKAILYIEPTEKPESVQFATERMRRNITKQNPLD